MIGFLICKSRHWAALPLALAALGAPMAVSAGVYDLIVQPGKIRLSGREASAGLANGTLPGPLLRWKEGEEVAVRVTNRLDEPTSIHWHGIILPHGMDGVPGISFPGIPPGGSFTYRFKLVQNGTYWYHGHSAMQEQTGLYGPIVIDPAAPERRGYDRDYVVMLSDWTDENPDRMLARLKKQSDYYNFQKRTVFDFFRDLSGRGVRDTVADRLAWGEMRMDPTDLADITGATYRFLVNGRSPDAEWSGRFQPGERIRLRFINGSAMTHFDLRLPGLPMQVVQADGQDVEPVEVDALRIAVAETYDVLVEPREHRAYAIFAEALDRSGHAKASLAPHEGMRAPVPEPTPRRLVTLAEMAAAHGGEHGGHGHASGAEPESVPAVDAGEHARHAMDHRPPSSAERSTTGHPNSPEMDHSAMPGMDHGQMDHSAMPGMDHAGTAGMDHGGHAMPRQPAAASTPGQRVLSYRDLESADVHPDWREPDREITLRLTGNMTRYIWSFDDRKYSEAQPIRLRYGERVRFRYVNQTMMNHPIHLHGMWQDLDVGRGARNPRKHVVNVAPGETVTVDVSADAPGEWAFHCHLLFHMDTGMFRKVIVEKPGSKAAPTPRRPAVAS